MYHRASSRGCSRPEEPAVKLGVSRFSRVTRQHATGDRWRCDVGCTRGAAKIFSFSFRVPFRDRVQTPQSLKGNRNRRQAKPARAHAARAEFRKTTSLLRRGMRLRDTTLQNVKVTTPSVLFSLSAHSLQQSPRAAPPAALRSNGASASGRGGVQGLAMQRRSC